MALVRERRRINLRLPLPPLYDRLPCFSFASSTAAVTSKLDVINNGISASDIEKLHVLGSGTGGIVYKVHHKTTGELYALKTVNGDMSSTFTRQLTREMEILRRTESPYIVRCHGIFEKPIAGEVSILMEYMDGGNLESLRGAVTEKQLAGFSRQILKGLSDIWSFGLMMLELFVGHFPLLPQGQRPDWATLMCAVCFGEPPRTPEGCSDEFRSFVDCCLRKESSERWTASQLLGHSFLREVPIACDVTGLDLFSG
ncbi:unnamed protein product [Arabidopsis lyrata]|nr:unnamed protein product [Arabidopsis lyrata]